MTTSTDIGTALTRRTMTTLLCMSLMGTGLIAAAQPAPNVALPKRKPAKKKYTGRGGSGWYAVPQSLYQELQAQPLHANSVISAILLRYQAGNAVQITLQMTTTWVGSEGQEPNTPQRLIVYDGILGTTTSATKLWDDHGTPLGRNRTWPPTPLAATSGYLTVLPLQMNNSSYWTQNSDYDGYMSFETYEGADEVMVYYEDGTVNRATTRPDIVANIHADNIVFYVPTADDIKRIIHL